MQCEELEGINITTTWEDKDKQNSSAYDIKGKEKILRMSEKKEKACDGYVHIYEYGKHLLHSTYERVCAEQETTISEIIIMLDSFKSDIK